MQSKQQKEKLERVVRFYQQEFEVLKVQCLQQKSVVAELDDALVGFKSQLRNIQSQTGGLGASIIDLQMVSRLMEKLQTEITQSQGRLDEAKLELGQRQAALRKKMSQLESLEKLIEKKTELISLELRRHEQQEADERYLNQHVSGSIK